MIQVVLVDANVLHSRVLRDYLVYAAADSLIRLRWSDTILDEMSRSLVNRLGLAVEQVDRLSQALNRFLPDASVTPQATDYAMFAELRMPDEDDRHVVAAAVAARADVLCTLNTKDFPPLVMERVQIRLRSPDEVLGQLLALTPHGMRAVHERILAARGGISGDGVLDALRRAGAIDTAMLLRRLLA